MRTVKSIDFVLLILLFPISQKLHAEDHFDPSFLEQSEGNAPHADLSRFATDDDPAGTYPVNIFINGIFYTKKTVTFTQGKNKLSPCLSPEDYNDLNINWSSPLVKKETFLKKNACLAPEDFITDAEAKLNLAQFKLNITIPQLALLTQVRGEVPESSWDEGITAIISNYSYSGSDTWNDTSTGIEENRTNFLNWQNGLNIGPWRLRDYTSWTKNDDTQGHWEHISSYLERDIRSLRGELTVGDFATSRSTFDSTQLRGLQVASDTDMLPDSVNGFAPIIRGIARSAAQVTVSDNGAIIYQTNVPPGPFAITDIDPVTSGGELDVTVKEADGSETHYQQSYATVPLLQREGQLNYDLAVGEYTDSADADKPMLGQFSIAYGLPWNLTFLGGIQSSPDYKAFDFGIGLDAALAGAFSADIMHAKADKSPWARAQSGQAIAFNYAKSLSRSDTDINISEKFYSPNYVSFQDSRDNSDTDSDKDAGNKRKQLTATLTQPLSDGKYSFFLSVNRTYYTSSSDRLYQVGFNTSIADVSIMLTLNASKQANDSEWDKQVAVNLSVPFAVFSPDSKSSAMLSYMVNHDVGGADTQQVGVSDTVLPNQSLSYDVTLGYVSSPDEKDASTGSVNLDHKANSGEREIGYNYDQHHRQLTYALSGSVIMHAGGVTFGQNISGAAALVSIPGAKNISVSGANGIYTDSSGYATLNSLTPYRHRDIQILTTKDTDSDIDLENTTAVVTPTKDALVEATYARKIGRKIVMTLSNQYGPLPFGTIVKIVNLDEEYYVADDGLVYLNGAPIKGFVTAMWGDGEHCNANYDLTSMAKNKKTGINMVSLLCN